MSRSRAGRGSWSSQRRTSSSSAGSLGPVTVLAGGRLDGREVGSAPHERDESVLCRERDGHRLGRCPARDHVGFCREALLARHGDTRARVRDHERDGRVSRGDLEHDPAALAVTEEPEAGRIHVRGFPQGGELRRDVRRLLGRAGVTPVARRFTDASLVERRCGDAPLEQAGPDRREVDVVVAVRRPRPGNHQHRGAGLALGQMERSPRARARRWLRAARGSTAPGERSRSPESLTAPRRWLVVQSALI